jgi:gamma-glutamylcyclotransferase (GGCT)/AIG2-like uncharacterized protein YtfP
MVDRVWARVLQCEPSHHRRADAALSNHQRLCVIGETYPGMIASAGQQVLGVAYFDVTTEQIAALDQFEGADYQRIPVSVTIDGSTVRCETYLYLPKERLSQEVWTLAHFDEAKFMKQYVGFAS